MTQSISFHKVFGTYQPDDICPVCRDPLGECQPIYAHEDGICRIHHICKACLDSCCLTGPLCPLCRKDIRAISDEGQETVVDPVPAAGMAEQPAEQLTDFTVYTWVYASMRYSSSARMRLEEFDALSGDIRDRSRQSQALAFFIQRGRIVAFCRPIPGEIWPLVRDASSIQGILQAGIDAHELIEMDPVMIPRLIPDYVDAILHRDEEHLTEVPRLN